jgi:Zn-dependent protease
MDDGDDRPSEPASPQPATALAVTSDTALVAGEPAAAESAAAKPAREPTAAEPVAAEPAADEPAPELIKLDIASDVRAAAENRYERRAHVPQKDVVLSQADEVEFRGAQKVMIDPPKTPTQQKTQLLVFSLAAFLLAGLVGGSSRSLVELAMLVGVIFVHELGHMAGMILFGYRDVRIFFIPFLGGAASGKKRGVAKWKEAIVLLLGPLPGIVAGVILLKVVHGDGLLHTLAMQLIILNALNLLPMHPLDGGQLFTVVLFSRNRHLELIFSGVTCALLGLGAVLGGMWFIAIIVVFIIQSLPYKKRILEAGHRLRDANLPGDPIKLSEPQQKRLWREMWDALPDRYRTRWRGQPASQARAMEEVLERATMRPPSVEATIFILLVWFAGLGGAAYGAMPPKKPPPAWSRYYNPDPKFSVELQGVPRHTEAHGLTQVIAGRCTVTYAAIAEDEQTWLARAGAGPRRRAFARGSTGFLVTGDPRCLDTFKLE